MDRSSLYNVIHLAVIFILIFMSFIVAQIFQASSNPGKHGALAVGILYLIFCLSNLSISSYLTQLIGTKLTLILASLTYVFFIASSIKYNVWLLYISAISTGLGAALLWTAQGAYVSVSINNYERANDLPSSSSQGFMNGVFFGIFQSYQILGNLLASFLFQFNYSQWIIFTIMSGIAGLGVFALVFLRPVQIPEARNQRSISGSLSMLLEVPFLLLLPTVCYAGLAQGFMFSAIPSLILSQSLKYLLFAFFGFVSTVSSIIFGKLSDYLGRLPTFAVGALVQMIVFALLLVLRIPPLDQKRVDVLVIIITCLSMGDAIYTIQFYAAMSILYGKTRPTDAFACMKAFQAGFSAIAFVAQVYLPFSVQVLCLMIVLSMSFIALIYEHYGVISLDTGKTIISMQRQIDKRIEIQDEVELPLATSSVNVEVVT